MSDTLGKMRDEIAKNPATDRLKEELRGYLQARAEHAVAGLGQKLGDTIRKAGDPTQGPGTLVGSLTKCGQALAEGKSPAQAAMKVGTSHVKYTLKEKVKGLFGKGRGKSGGGKSKSVVIVEDIDVGVPLREAYDQWTQFQEFSTFAKGVVSVETSDDTTSNWKVKVAKSTRSWQANVTEQVPDEKIVWTTEGAKGTVKGVVTFHALGDSLTRVLLVLEYFPKGLFEKTGNIWRAQGRRARLDLKLYRKFIMMRGEATDGWRGEIRDGEVVLDHEEAVEEEERAEQDEDAPDGRSDDEDAQDGDDGEESDEDGEHADDDPEASHEDDEQDGEEPYDDEPYEADAYEEPHDDDADPADEPEAHADGDEEFEDEPEPEDAYEDDAYEDDGDDEAEADADDEADVDDEADEEPEDAEPEPPRRRRRTAAARR
ncbi:SRPBCC family protein [Streptomyces sp. NPDC047108]|uniref:SRPBCC family protein n=1 Tax=Streptomyces sp. NPDC047108 TaxID=3155025 RepID=UPI0033FFFC8B